MHPIVLIIDDDESHSKAYTEVCPDNVNAVVINNLPLAMSFFAARIVEVGFVVVSGSVPGKRLDTIKKLRRDGFLGVMIAVSPNKEYAATMVSAGCDMGFGPDTLLEQLSQIITDYTVEIKKDEATGVPA